MLIDADKQRTLAKWHARRVENWYEPRLTLVEKRGNLHAAIDDLAEHYDHVIVDVAGDDNEEMRTAMTVADLLIVVLRASQFDAETLEEFVDVITAAKNFNPKLVARALFSQVPTNAFETETEDVSEYVRDFPEITALKTVIGSRKLFRDSVTDGRGMLEMSANSSSQRQAKKEVRQLVEEVYNLMTIARNKKRTPEQNAAIEALGSAAEDRGEHVGRPVVERSGEKERRRRSAKMNYYADAEQQGRIRAAYFAGRDRYGWRTMTDMQLEFVMKNIQALEQEYNDGEPFNSVGPGRIPVGRPIS